jgi:FMN-dependent NADH-azoreductase
MATLLHIDSSPLYGRSVSRQLSGAFVERWKSLHPGATVIERDLNATSIPPISAEWVGAAYTPEEARAPQQKKQLELSDTLLAELARADEYVIGVPMHNFSVPSVLKLWIDQISRVGKTFSYENGTPKGCSSVRRQRSSLRPEASMTLRRKWPLSISSSLTCGLSSASWA